MTGREKRGREREMGWGGDENERMKQEITE